MPSRQDVQPQQTDSYSSGTDPLALYSRRQPDLNAVGNAFSVNLGQGSLNLSVEEQGGMMKSIGEIFELEEEVQGENDDMADGDEEESVVDLEDQQRRTERLKGALSMLAQLWWSDSEHMDLVAERLADGSRDRECFLFGEMFSSHPYLYCSSLILHSLF